eukprot:SAG31_NODE_1203_length_9413_cov_4.778076_10_plen_108_part_00
MHDLARESFKKYVIARLCGRGLSVRAGVWHRAELDRAPDAAIGAEQFMQIDNTIKYQEWLEYHFFYGGVRARARTPKPPMPCRKYTPVIKKRNFWSNDSVKLSHLYV